MKGALIYLFAAVLAAGAGNASAALMSMSDSDGDAVVYDDLQGVYWMQRLGAFDRDISNILDTIDYANATSYYGINNWHLASPDEMAGLEIYPLEEIAAHFEPSISFSGTKVYQDPVCFPGFGGSNCFGGVSDNYTRTEWYGIYDSTNVLTLESQHTIYAGFGAALMEFEENVEEEDGYHFIDGWGCDSLCGWEASSYGYDEALHPMDGAWVVGSPVPVPAAAWLFVGGLMGLVSVVRKCGGGGHVATQS